jgi:mediator of RNA polymerase II transcription subunit 31
MARFTPPAPEPPSARFTLELEFVLSLSNPYYLSHLALVYPHLLNPPASDPANTSTASQDSDASRFAAYLAYLYDYWRTPQYSKYLSHPGAVLRSLEQLQQERFRKDIIRPDVIAKLLEGSEDETNGRNRGQEEQEGQEDGVATGEGEGRGKLTEMDTPAGGGRGPGVVGMALGVS